MWNRTYSYNFETGESTLFHTYDYVVFGITLGLSAVELIGGGNGIPGIPGIG
jgi:hypothetical protein